MIEEYAFNYVSSRFLSINYISDELIDTILRLMTNFCYDNTCIRTYILISKPLMKRFSDIFDLKTKFRGLLINLYCMFL